MGVIVLNERERRTLEELERSLQHDRLVAHVARSHRRERWLRRFWLLSLILSGVLVIGMITLSSGAGAAGSLFLAALSAVALHFTRAATS